MCCRRRSCQPRLLGFDHTLAAASVMSPRLEAATPVGSHGVPHAERDDYRTPSPRQPCVIGDVAATGMARLTPARATLAQPVSVGAALAGCLLHARAAPWTAAHRRPDACLVPPQARCAARRIGRHRLRGRVPVHARRAPTAGRDGSASRCQGGHLCCQAIRAACQARDVRRGETLRPRRLGDVLPSSPRLFGAVHRAQRRDESHLGARHRPPNRSGSAS